jgi:UDP-3-O-[3-hydroxymyristoyl] glucosamine N-acyltransferase
VEKVYLGTNSSIKEKLSITDDVVIGLNTGIVKSIEESGTYIGQNIRKIR